jgi:ADP-dependent NAD(P)H-hydrate dehydratase / NAD(P)H-hydrate epimerase
MIKILSAAQTRAWDDYTIAQEPIASIDLMERACNAFADWFFNHIPHYSKVVVVCGPGNNGGDGLGIARILSALRYEVTVCLMQEHANTSHDFTLNLNRLPQQITRIAFHPNVNLPPCDVVIDAMFGSGLSRPLTGIWAQVVSIINQLQATRIAVDIPSGLFADRHATGAIIEAHHTVTFQAPKLTFLLPENEKYVGQWHVVDIGLSQNFITAIEAHDFYLDAELIRSLIKPRTKFSHKGKHGHTLIMAGSHGKIGANVLATRAALRAGSGLVTSYLPTCGYTVLQSAAPEAMVLTDADANHLTTVPDLSNFSALAVGPGIGTDKKTQTFIAQLLSKSLPPAVFDADALNILSTNSNLLNLLPANSILTPHPGEFKRLVGDWKDDFERLAKQRTFARQSKCVVVLKGAHTSITMPNGQVYFNSTGNPGMATGGSGDVLTGIVAALLAQGYGSENAALLGVFVHGMAGDLAAKKRFFIVASDIIEAIPTAFSALAAVAKP